MIITHNWEHLQGLLTFTNNFSFKMCYDVLTRTTNFTDKMCNYTSAFLRSIRKTSRTDFSNFQLSHILMSSIVALGLKKQPRDRPYRMSRAETRLVHYIKTIVSKKKTEKYNSGVNKSNLIEIKKKAKSTMFFTIAHVNVRSVRNKAPQVQLELGTQGIEDHGNFSENQMKKNLFYYNKSHLQVMTSSLILDPMETLVVGWQ